MQYTRKEIDTLACSIISLYNEVSILPLLFELNLEPWKWNEILDLMIEISIINFVQKFRTQTEPMSAVEKVSEAVCNRDEYKIVWGILCSKNYLGSNVFDRKS